MSRVITGLRGWAGGWADADIRFERLAVTPEQIIDTNLPTRETKRSDSRAPAFIERYGHIRDGGSVEVDAIPGSTVRRILTDAIGAEIDHNVWRATEAQQDTDRAELASILARLTD